MRRLLLLALLTLPVRAEVKQLLVDDLGVVSLTWMAEDNRVESLALEGRNQSDQCWRPLGVWNLPAARMHLETLPGSACLEYRVLTFTPAGFLAEQRILPELPATLTQR